MRWRSRIPDIVVLRAILMPKKGSQSTYEYLIETTGLHPNIVWNAMLRCEEKKRFTNSGTTSRRPFLEERGKEFIKFWGQRVMAASPYEDTDALVASIYNEFNRKFPHPRRIKDFK